MWRTACPYVGYSESVHLLYLSKGKRNLCLVKVLSVYENWQTAVLLFMLQSQWATTYSLGKGHTDVASLPLVIWCSWVRRDTGSTRDLAHHSLSGAQWRSRSTLILERASILACTGKREAPSPALDWCCPLQTFKEGTGNKALNSVSPKSTPLSALAACSTDWNNSWTILHTHPTLLDRICEK